MRNHAVFEQARFMGEIKEVTYKYVQFWSDWEINRFR